MKVFLLSLVLVALVIELIIFCLAVVDTFNCRIVCDTWIEFVEFMAIGTRGRMDEWHQLVFAVGNPLNWLETIQIFLRTYFK